MRRLRVADPVRCSGCGTTIERGEIAYYEAPTWMHGECLVADVDASLDPGALERGGVPGWLGNHANAVFRSGPVRVMPPVLLGLGVVVLAAATFAPIHLGLVVAVAVPLLGTGLRSGYVGVEVTGGGEVVVRGWTGVTRCQVSEVLAVTEGRVPVLVVDRAKPIPAWALMWASPEPLAAYLGVEVFGAGGSGHTA